VLCCEVFFIRRHKALGRGTAPRNFGETTRYINLCVLVS